MTEPDEATCAPVDTRDESATPACPIFCDPDCEAVCHEDHVAGHKKKHWPYDCPAADRYGWGGSDFIAAAVKRLRGERDDARQQLAAMTARAEKAENALAAETATCKRWLRRLVEQGERADNAVAKCEDLASENAKLRARLAEIGEPKVEWGVRGTQAADSEAWVGYAICETEEHARAALDHYRAVDRNERNPVERTLVKRLAGEWHEVPDA